jgi:predicted permease
LRTLISKLLDIQPGQLPALYQQLQGRLERLPGVRSASLSLNSPQNLCCINLNISFGGRSEAWIEKVNVVFLRVSPHYFETIGTPLLRGRGVTERDMPSSQHVAIVDSAFAQKFFPGEDPIGKHFGLSLPGHGSDYQIVGVAKDTKYRSPGSEQSPMFFLPFTQTTQYEPDGYRRLETATLYAQSIQLHVAGAPERYEDSFRQTLASTNPNLSLIKVKTYREQVAVQFNRERLIARLTALFGIFALLLASVGLYGVTAYNVEGRTREIGVRIALGANRGKVLSMVLYGALWQVCGGLCMGIPLAMLCGRYLAHELYGLGSFDLLALGEAIVVLSVCAMLAALFPAWRAASVEPIRALRAE